MLGLDLQGVESYRVGKSLGITLPVYPMRGSLFTAPIKVRAIKDMIKLENLMTTSTGDPQE